MSGKNVFSLAEMTIPSFFWGEGVTQNTGPMDEA